MPIGAKTMNLFAKSEFFDYKVFNVLLENFVARVAFLRIFSTNYSLPRSYLTRIDIEAHPQSVLELNSDLGSGSSPRAYHKLWSL